jgi:hypothetical protein
MPAVSRVVGLPFAVLQDMAAVASAAAQSPLRVQVTELDPPLSDNANPVRSMCAEQELSISALDMRERPWSHQLDRYPSHLIIWRIPDQPKPPSMY